MFYQVQCAFRTPSVHQSTSCQDCGSMQCWPAINCWDRQDAAADNTCPKLNLQICGLSHLNSWLLSLQSVMESHGNVVQPAVSLKAISQAQKLERIR
jgi:hypothetical protein